MAEMEMNAQTVVLLIVVLVLFAFALRRARDVFGGKAGCHGGGSNSSKASKPVVVADTDESHYPYRLELVVGSMTCDRCKAAVENSVNSIPGMWARVDLGERRIMVLGKSPIEQAAVEDAVEAAGYYVVRQPE